MSYIKTPGPRKGYRIAAIHELPDGTTETHWLTVDACHQFMRDWVKAEIESEYGITADEWLARAAELRQRERIGKLWQIVDKRPKDELTH